MSAWKTRQGRVEGEAFQEECVAHSHTAWVDTGQSGDIPELGLGREERGLSSLYSTSCSCQGCARRALFCSKWQLNTQNHGGHSLGHCWHGEISLLCTSGAPGNAALGLVLSKGHQNKARLKPDCWQSRLSWSMHKDL